MGVWLIIIVRLLEKDLLLINILAIKNFNSLRFDTKLIFKSLKFFDFFILICSFYDFILCDSYRNINY